VFGLVAAENGVLYAMANNSVYSVNLATGTGTLVTTYSKGLGAAYGATSYSGATQCLLNWAERNYSNFFAPAGSATQQWSVYTYRYYAGTRIYLGVSSADNHVYYMGADGQLQNAGPTSTWFPQAGC
jgi:hypothetical protein